MCINANTVSTDVAFCLQGSSLPPSFFPSLFPFFSPSLASFPHVSQDALEPQPGVIWGTCSSQVVGVKSAVHFLLRLLSQAEILTQLPSTLGPLLWTLSVPPLPPALETVPAPACLQPPDFEVPSILSALSQCLGLSQHNVASPGCPH